MSLWIALGVIWVFGLVLFVFSYLGYREQVRWHEDFDRRNPGVAEKLGVKPRWPSS
jgi:hypothetical protein